MSGVMVRTATLNHLGPLVGGKLRVRVDILNLVKACGERVGRKNGFLLNYTWRSVQDRSSKRPSMDDPYRTNDRMWQLSRLQLLLQKDLGYSDSNR